MSNQANVSSTEAIADFRSALLVYAAKMRPMLDDSGDYVTRTREWMRVEKRIYWENQMRQTSAKLNEAQQNVFSAELSRLRPPSAAELAAVQRLKRDFHHAEDKLRNLKKVLMNYDRVVLPRAKQEEQLRAWLTVELPKAARHLEKLLATLEAYAESHKPAPAPAAPLAPVENSNPDSKEPAS
ncbi:MAG: hypothetical protein ACO1QB_17140 [Verrucomicrobiales bacterium]